MIRRLLHNFIFRRKHKSCKIGKGVYISRDADIGKDCRLGTNCSITSNVVLGNNISIGESVRLSNIRISDNSAIESGVKIVGTAKGKITIGKECYVGVNNILDTSNDISIGDFVHIAGASTGLWCHSSAQMCMNNIPLNDKGRDKYRPTAPITIENNAYIGGNCTIYPGVTIGHHSIIAPNSAVTKDVDAFTLVGGVPAKEIKKLPEVK